MKSFIVVFWASVFNGLRWVSFFQIARSVLPENILSDGCIDAWVLGNLILSIASLCVSYAHGVTYWELALLIWGAVRVIEILVYQANVLLFDAYRAAQAGRRYALRGYRRIFILSLHNYIEIVFWFAFFYHKGNSLFSDSQEALSSSVGALYYSTVTMSTLGFGEITPNCDLGRLLVTVHLSIAIFLTLAIIARFISYLPPPDSLDEFEKTQDTT